MATPNSAYQISNPLDTSKPFTFINITNSIKLTSDNYLVWKLQIRAILIGHDLLRYVNGECPSPSVTIITDGKEIPNPAYISWLRQDQLLFGALVGTLSPPLLPLVSQTTTSKGLWDTLAETYAKPSRGHIKQLKSQLRKASKGTRTITDYVHHVKAIADKLASLGKPIETEDLVERILEGLDASYNPIKLAVNARDTAISFEELHEKLINHELTVHEDQDTTSPMPLTAFAAHTRSQPNRSYSRSPSFITHSSLYWTQYAAP